VTFIVLCCIVLALAIHSAYCIKRFSLLTAMMSNKLLGLVELFDVKYYRDLEMRVRGHSRSLKVVPLKAWVQFPIRFP